MPTMLEPTASSQEAPGRLLVATAKRVTPEPVTPLRVAFVGQAGVGKTTQAQLLRDRFKGDLLHFAAPLKKMTLDLYGAERMANESFARTAYQEMGAMARRLAPTVWVEKLCAKVSPNRNCFIDDCRYLNEYHALLRLDFIVIKLVAEQKTLTARRPTMTEEQWQHESERDIAFIHADAFFSTGEDDEQAVHQKIVTWLLEWRANISAQ